MTATPVFEAGALRAFARTCFETAGLGSDQAAAVADVLVWADLRGHGSHGVMRMPTYLGWIASGLINKDAKPEVTLRKGALLRVNGNMAIGAAAMTQATDLAIAQARETAVAWTLVQDHTHAGAIGFYADRIMKAGMAAVVMSALRPMMAYHGTRHAAASTNPLAMGIPGGILLDMSTSASSRGKVGVAKMAGKPIAPGIAIDKDGRPTTDPNLAETLLPMAGAKGAGLSLMIECLTSLALGNPLISSALNDAKLMKNFKQNSLVVAVDVSVLGGDITGQAAQLATTLKAQERAEGFDEIRLPGERGAREEAKRLKDGVPVPAKTWDLIAEAAGKLGVALPAQRA